MEIKPLDADPDLDPRLQRIVHAGRRGRRSLAASSTMAGEAAPDVISLKAAQPVHAAARHDS